MMVAPKTDEEKKKKVEVDFGNLIYSASVRVFEKLESEGAIEGNGHHMAQKLSADAVEFLKRRWR